MFKKKTFRKSSNKGNSYDEPPSRNKKANKEHPRSEVSKHKRDFIDWDVL